MEVYLISQKEGKIFCFYLCLLILVDPLKTFFFVVVVVKFKLKRKGKLLKENSRENEESCNLRNFSFLTLENSYSGIQHDKRKKIMHQAKSGHLGLMIIWVIR